MIQPKTSSDKLLFNTVRISGTTDSGASATATGFLFDFPSFDDRVIPGVVTNRHVYTAIESGEFSIHRSDGKTPNAPLNDSIKVHLPSFKDMWILHPNPEIDLCAAPLIYVLDRIGIKIEEVYRVPFNANNILDDQALLNLRGIEDVVMVGYPQGFWDNINNMPLVRRGITSTHAGIDFKGKPEALIDMACFVGSSGSPVVLFNEGLVPAEGPNSFTLGSRCALLGVLHSGFLMTAQGEIEYQDIPTVLTPFSKTQLTCHLGTYVKSRELLVLGEEMRQQLSLDLIITEPRETAE
jgi:hypothetical protein